MGRKLYRPFGMAVMVAAIAAPAVGQGSSVYSQSACVTARGGAAVAAPCGDASSIYYNPAGIAFIPSALSAGFTAIYNTGSFTYDQGPLAGQTVEREATTPIVPHGYFSIRFGNQDRLAAGFGVWAPYGLGIEWPEDFEGRFISWKSELRGLYLQPTIAYQVVPGRLSIGGGPQIVLGRLELNQYVSGQLVNPALPATSNLASGNLEGTGTGIGGHIGILYQHDHRLSLGARYMHSVKIDLEGDAIFEQQSLEQFGIPDALVAPQFQPGAPLGPQTVSAELTLPPQAVVGIRFAATPQFALAFDYQWTGWNTFDVIEPEFEVLDAPPLVLNYEDAHTFRLGGTYLASPALALRGGFIVNTAATPDETVTPILPEAERWLVSGGIGYDFGTIRTDLVYQYLNQADRRGRVLSPPPGTSGETLNVGEYESSIHQFGITFSYGLGGMR